MIGSSASGITNNSSSPRYYEWINLRNPLGQHGHTGQPYSLAFRVKFWVPAHLILQESVRNIFYMQAKSDLLDGRLRATDWECAARLGALLAQGDEIKFDPNALSCDDPIDVRSNHSIGTASASASTASAATDTATANSSGHTTSPIDGHSHSDGGHTSDNAYTDDDCSSISSTSDMTAVGCVSLGSLSNHKDSMSKSKKRKLSKQRLSLDECDESDNENGDVREYSPLHVYEDYVIQIEDDIGPMPADFLRKIAQEHAKLVKTPPKSAKYWLLQSIFKLSGFGEETFSGIRVSSTSSSSASASSGPHTSSLSRNRSVDATGDWSDYVRARSNSSCHDNNTAQRCDISVGPHGLLITTPDEQTRFVLNDFSDNSCVFHSICFRFCVGISYRNFSLIEFLHSLSISPSLQ